ncbi:CsbD family protein [Undibacterium sp. Ji50W]|uniref:CsbD family protein n=1 Tax=Undibacterium sp. Ji50W TaxID=3413041 RepID=UPI003BF2384A
MNKNQIKGTAKNIAGKVQENTGKLVGNKEQEIKGQRKQIEGKIEKPLGDAQEAIKDIVKQ